MELVDLTESDREENNLVLVKPKTWRRSVERMVGFFNEKEDDFVESPTPRKKKKRKKCKFSPDLTSLNLRERKKKRELETSRRNSTQPCPMCC